MTNRPQLAGILFFDGQCGMCTRSARLARRLNRTGLLRTLPLQTPGTAERLGVAPGHLLDAVRWLGSCGAVYAGAEAANAAVSAALGTRIPLRLYRIPGVRQLEDAVYRWVAEHRYRFPGMTPHCQTHPGQC